MATGRHDSFREVFMSRAGGQSVLTLVLAGWTVAACSFAPVSPAGPTGAAGSGGTSGGTSGSAGRSGVGTGGTGQGTGNGTGTGGDVGPMGGAGGDMTCGQSNTPLQMLPPDVLIVQDKSLSMNDDSNDKSCTGGCGANSKWSQVSAAIENVVMTTQANVDWGLKFFGNDNMCGVTAGATVGIAPNNYTAIQAAFSGTAPSSYTPTETAINSAVAYMQTLTDPNPKYLLLATDGLPNCPPGGGNATADDSPGAETAVTNAKAAGLSTFVVGIATTADAMATKTLNQMAMNGGVPQTGAATAYYAVSDTATLETALNSILSGIVSCSITLPPNPPANSTVGISVTTPSGDIAVAQDPTNGWSYAADMKSIVFNGSACASLMDGSYSNIIFSYTCAGGRIIIP
jgi:hypothetical protein